MSFLQNITNQYKDITEQLGLTTQQAEELDALDGKKDNKYNGKSLFDVVNEQKEKYDNRLIKIAGDFFDYAKAHLESDPEIIKIQEEIKEKETNKENKKIAREIIGQIFKIGFTNLDEPISKINGDNVLEVLSSYKKIADKLNLHLDNETLFEAILDEKISDEEKKEHINHIKNALIERAQNLSGDTSKIQELFTKALDTALEKKWPFQNADELNNLFNNFVEIIEQLEKLEETNKKDFKGFSMSMNMNYSNGYFDENSTQMAGNCWIHAGINNMLQNPRGKEIINNLVYKNTENGSVTVYLPGAAEKGFPKPNGDGMYTYSEATLLGHSLNISTGDGDYTAFILAINDFRAQSQNNYNDGGTFREFCKIIFGEDTEDTIISGNEYLYQKMKTNLTYLQNLNKRALAMDFLDDENKKSYEKELEKNACQLELLEISEIENPSERYNKIREKFENENFILFASVDNDTDLHGELENNNVFETISGHAYTILEMNENSVVLEESNHPGERIIYKVEDFMEIFTISVLALETV